MFSQPSPFGSGFPQQQKLLAKNEQSLQRTNLSLTMMQ